MRVLIQRVTKASVTIEGKIKFSIGKGLLVLVGVEEADTQEDLQWLSQKIVNLRIFDDAQGVMNLSVKEIAGEILIISQFTLHAATKKGNRPSYIKAAKPDVAIPLYESFVKQIEIDVDKKVGTGEFGADMQLELINDGPVTIWMDSKERDY
ncbi:MAG: D-aminoacyl-tRNA deacylase [Bacteroidia bacterium]